MTMVDIDWGGLSELSGDALKSRVFAIIRDASMQLQASEDDPKVLEVVPRLAELLPKRAELASYRQLFSSLARATGLWNYIDRETADTSDALVAETVTAQELDGITFHREQVAALNELFAGNNLILSAPTSFGKSILVDALLASGKYKRVAIVLPTIALLDEFRRRIGRRFGTYFQVVMHHTDEAPSEGSVIFLGTQERIISRSDLGTIDLTVVDEFYKLDPGRRDERSVTLNAAVYKLLNRSRQFFFLGPNIDGVRVSDIGKWKFQFLRTRFSTVAVDTYDLRGEENKEDRLIEEIAEDDNWPALVFVSSPDKANRIAYDATFKVAVSDDGAQFADWIRENVGRRWQLSRIVEWGFAIHQGRIPRAMASHMIRLFNDGTLPVMFCTSTLIEGVNTAAKTVMIYDKTINRADYDFFTFSNIRGRAGRLGQHHVGRVMLFNEPPAVEETNVSPTLFGDDDEAPDDYVVHLEPKDTSDAVDDRIEALKDRLELDAAGLRIAATIGLDNALALKREVMVALRSGPQLIWNGYPRYDNIVALCQAVSAIRRPSDFGAFSVQQLAYFISALRKSRTIKAFLREYDDNLKGGDEIFENIFKFLRSCEYGLPQVFSVVELFVNLRGHSADYSLFLRELSRWFRSETLKNLEEEGVPIQISERYEVGGETRAQLVGRLLAATRDESADLTAFERQWISAALDIRG